MQRGRVKTEDGELYGDCLDNSREVVDSRTF